MEMSRSGVIALVNTITLRLTRSITLENMKLPTIDVYVSGLLRVNSNT